MLSAAVDISSVRLADPDDEGDLLAMLREMHKESGLRKANDEPLAFSEPKVLATIRNATRRDPQNPQTQLSWAGIIGERGKIEGSLCVSVCEPWYSEDVILNEVWNFVPTPFRRTDHASTLMGFAKAMADSLRIDPLIAGVMSVERHEAKLRLYARAFRCRPLGGIFQYNPVSDSAAGA